MRVGPAHGTGESLRTPQQTVSVVICTKDRPRELAACLDALGTQARLPEEVIVVDASGSPAVAEVESFQGRAGSRSTALLVRADPGLTAQRNIGTGKAKGDVVLFLDDDVVLEPSYMAQLMAVYEHDPLRRIGGVGGVLDPDPTPHESTFRRLFRKVFLLPGWGRGRVKPSGHPEYALSPRDEMDVEFLSGCNMSFRREVMETLRFDERLAGYAAGEDIQFSYRVSRRWRLVLTPQARLDHREAGAGRPDQARRVEMGLVNHYMFFREQVAATPLHWLCYLWASLGVLLLTLRHPGQGRLRGVGQGFTRVIGHLLGFNHGPSRTALPGWSAQARDSEGARVNCRSHEK